MLFGLDLTHSAKVWYFLTLLLHCYGEADIKDGSQRSKRNCCLLSDHDKPPTSAYISVTVTQEHNVFSNTCIQEYSHFCAIRRAGPSQFSYSKSNTSLHTCEALLTFQFSVIFLNVNGFKTEGFHLYCGDFQLFYRIQDGKFPELPLAKPNS